MAFKPARQGPKNPGHNRLPARRGTTQGRSLHSETIFSQTAREEQANTASHLLGCLLALAALPLLAGPVAGGQPPLRQFGVTVFIASMVLMYGVSAAYHALPVGAAKRALRRCDHAVIFVFIAGSYTPFALGQIERGEGGALLAAVWGIAALGVTLKLSNRVRQPLVSTAIYLVFGWLVGMVAQPLLITQPPPCLAWLVGGGLAYSLGSLFYLLDHRMRYSHFVWHLFVITGSSCHLLAVQQALV